MQATINPQSLLRLPDIIGKKATKTSPAVAGLLPVSRSTFYNLINAGKVPKPTKLGASSVWRASEVLALVEKIGSGTFAA